MKIYRCIAEDGRIRYGLLKESEPGFIQVLKGGMFTTFKPTDAIIKIKKLLSPLDPPSIFALGFSYRKHADEAGTDVSPHPVVFMKAATSVVGHGDKILLPSAGPDKVDYEGELAVVIGKRAKNVSVSEAMNYILGYTCANDVSARDWQFEKQRGQWIRGKSFDTFCPLGPCLVTREELPDPNRLYIRTVLNEQVVQDAVTDDMIYDVATIVSNLSQSLTLLPGTVILTGTPEGVGFTRNPPLFLKAGDSIAVTIENIGTLTNTVEKER
jgi:2-keto-4-pentenoate hydratase/2-oxohepta-3-ene-1,7-dioic acid hydratase in catechol pathway